MPGHTWLGAAASFLAMWVVMMVAMMLPSLVPTLWRYRQAGLGPMTALVGVGLFRRLDRLSGCSPIWSASRCRARPDRGRRRRVDGRASAVHRLEGTSSRLLPGRSYARPDRLATRLEPRSPLQSVLPRSDGDSLGSRVMDLRAMAISGGGHQRRTSCTAPGR